MARQVRIEDEGAFDHVMARKASLEGFAIVVGVRRWFGEGGLAGVKLLIVSLTSYLSTLTPYLLW